MAPKKGTAKNEGTKGKEGASVGSGSGGREEGESEIRPLGTDAGAVERMVSELESQLGLSRLELRAGEKGREQDTQRDWDRMEKSKEGVEVRALPALASVGAPGVDCVPVPFPDLLRRWMITPQILTAKDVKNIVLYHRQFMEQKEKEKAAKKPSARTHATPQSPANN